MDELFASLGYTRAGGMWGDAQWKELVPGRLAVGVGQEYEWEAKQAIPDKDLEALAAPEVPDRRCVVYVYRGPFYEGWRPTDGEAPAEEAAKRVVLPSVAAAVDYVAGLAA